MTWKIGQQMICDCLERPLTGTVIRADELESVIILCSTDNTLVCGRQKSLEHQGWRVDQDYQEELNQDKLA